MSKHLRVWALCIYQMLIASELIVTKSKSSANLLVKHPLLYSEKPLQSQTGKLKPRNWLCKISVAKSSKKDKTGKRTYTKNVVTEENNVDKLA